MAYLILLVFGGGVFITSIYKSGEKSEMDNHRPISDLPVLFKVIERVVYIQLYDYLCKSHLLTYIQFGFRRGSSTEHAVTFLTDSIRMNFDKGYLTGALFIDLPKAFDTVDRTSFLLKLPAYGIIGRELRWLESLQFDRKHFVVFDRIRSDLDSIACGEPQGLIIRSNYIQLANKWHWLAIREIECEPICRRYYYIYIRKKDCNSG